MHAQQELKSTDEQQAQLRFKKVHVCVLMFRCVHTGSNTGTHGYRQKNYPLCHHSTVKYSKLEPR